jgi:urease accessory protein
MYDIIRPVSNPGPIRNPKDAPWMTDEWLVWQLADATFPAGGLAHSGGLEAAAKWGELNDAHRLGEFLLAQLTHTAHTSIPPMQAAWKNPVGAAAVDRFCHAFISNHVANRASRAQGKAFLLSAQAAFDLSECEAMRDDIGSGRMHGHFAVVFGAVAAALKIDVDQSVRLYLHITLRGLISSGVRLNIIGPLEGQALQHRLGPFLGGLAARCQEFGPPSMAQTAPLVEILQAGQDRLYSRLFQS